MESGTHGPTGPPSFSPLPCRILPVLWGLVHDEERRFHKTYFPCNGLFVLYLPKLIGHLSPVAIRRAKNWGIHPESCRQVSEDRVGESVLVNKALSKRSKRAARAPPRRRGEALRKLYEGGSFQLLSGRGVFFSFSLDGGCPRRLTTGRYGSGSG